MLEQFLLGLMVNIERFCILKIYQSGAYVGVLGSEILGHAKGICRWELLVLLSKLRDISPDGTLGYMHIFSLYAVYLGVDWFAESGMKAFRK